MEIVDGTHQCYFRYLLDPGMQIQLVGHLSASFICAELQSHIHDVPQ
jgi:hypothetical protein